MIRAMDTVLDAAIYGRVSKKNQRSVRDQQAANRVACDRLAWPVIEMYEDDDRSASRFATRSRPDWERLLEDMDARRFSVLVLWEPSRGDRELEMWARLLNTCRRLGVLIHITSHERTYDVCKPRDWKAMAEDGVSSAYESEQTRERVLRTVAATAASGMPHGKILYGYRREYDPATGVLRRQVLDETPRAAIASGCMADRSRVLAVERYTPVEIIRECARRVLAGETVYTIAQNLNRRGIPTPRRAPVGWQPGQVKEQVTNPGYIARRIHQGRDVGAAQWPPILDEGTFYAVVAKTSDPARRTSREGAIQHLLSGLAVCGVCSQPLRVVKNRGYLSYTCWRRVPGAGKSFHVARIESRLDAFVEGVIIERLTQVDTEEVWAANDEQHAGLSAVLAEADEKRARLDGFYDQAARGELAPMGLARIEKALLGEIDALERRARSVRLAPVVRDLAHSDPEVVAARWGDLTMSQRREALRALTVRISITPAGKGRRNYEDEDVTQFVWPGQELGERG